jgi:hypothetical protein
MEVNSQPGFRWVPWFIMQWVLTHTLPCIPPMERTVPDLGRPACANKHTSGFTRSPQSLGEALGVQISSFPETQELSV